MTTDRHTPRAPGSPTAGVSRAAGDARTLGELLEPLGLRLSGAVAAAVVSSIEYDSRKVEPGGLFVAVRGLATDGHLYVSQAAGRGAVAALVEESTGTEGILEIAVRDTRTALGLVAHEFYGRPSEKLRTHAITGTNGKTTTLYLLDSILQESGLATGVVGTLGYRVGDHVVEGGMTSPESLDLARLLASMVDEGVGAVTMEVSSHALTLRRNAGARFDTATFTNLSRDHLDFHGTIAEYAAAKKLLFGQLAGAAGKPGATAIVNTDDEYGRELASYVRSTGNLRLVTYGRSGADVCVVEAVSGPSGTAATFDTPAGGFTVNLRLISEFNVMNALAATAIAVSQGVPLEAIATGLSRVESVEGRLETVDAGQDFTIVVDYAHTPDALEKTIAAVGKLVPGRLITVFGCGGDRDRGKRPMMGEIAATGSDVVVVTSDNPRSEDPAAIISEIVGGVKSAGGSAELAVIEDRREAIAHAIGAAAAGDLVLIAGKGHEDYQIVGDTKLHFDDREEARAAVEGGKADRGRDGEGAAD
ncbi:MAG: UDP-N-acetylmuramoyl-L-alanyl-D-glutamate--2,6-diaminopimelate ligase [Candidatus Eisenbacteria bacterium]